MAPFSFVQTIDGKEVTFTNWSFPTTDYRFTKALPPAKSSLSKDEYIQYVIKARQQMVRPTHWPVPESVAVAYGESFFQENARAEQYMKRPSQFYVPFQSLHDTVTETNHPISFVYSSDQWSRFKRRNITAPKVPSCAWKVLIDVKTQYLEHPDGSFPGSGKRRITWPGKPGLARNILKPKWMLWVEQNILGVPNPNKTLIGPQTFPIKLKKPELSY